MSAYNYYMAVKLFNNQSSPYQSALPGATMGLGNCEGLDGKAGT